MRDRDHEKGGKGGLVASSDVMLFVQLVRITDGFEPLMRSAISAISVMGVSIEGKET